MLRLHVDVSSSPTNRCFGGTPAPAPSRATTSHTTGTIITPADRTLRARRILRPVLAPGAVEAPFDAPTPAASGPGRMAGIIS